MISLPFSKRSKRILSVGILILLALYPIIIYMGLETFEHHWVLGAVIFVLIVRGFLSAESAVSQAQMRRFTLVLLPALLIVAWLFSPKIGVKSYPILVNLGFFVFFASSLLNPSNVIEAIARRMESDFPETAVPYTRKVCIAWCVFFLVNGSIAFVSLFMSDEVWALYNGLISYIMIGLFFGVEFVVRQKVKKKNISEQKDA